MTLNVEIIPFLHNNYAFIIYDKHSKEAVALEVGRSKPVLQFLKNNDLKLTQIWITHYHYDHCEGVTDLVKIYDCPVYGPANPPEGLGNITVINSKTILEFCNQTFQVIETPGHVEHHLAFYNQSNRLLFPGDTLFGGGAAVIISDDAGRLWQTMQKLRILPDNTRVFYPHEVTARNIRFALKYDPNNEALKLRYNFVKAQLKRKRNPCPSMLQMEKQTNPFLRADDPELQTSLAMEDKSGENVFRFLMDKLEQSYGMGKA